ncbi:hypothetical protein [Sphingopyxis sp.]|uniref:hypothetical protein n=1 Tax=Sphingopyxis sp. TaxID=1908224 RepID=UPI003D6D4D15
MKADEPAPIVKYGMATDETQRIVECHHALMAEQQQLAAGVLDHNLRMACIAKALFDARDGKPSVPAPVAAPEADVEPVPEVAPPTVVITERARPDNLRERLGLR